MSNRKDRAVEPIHAGRTAVLVEVLEPRLLLAAATIGVVSHGNLVITGSDLDTSLLGISQACISQVIGNVRVYELQSPIPAWMHAFLPPE